MSRIYVETIPESLDECTYSFLNTTRGINSPLHILLSLSLTVLLLTFTTASLRQNSPHIENGSHHTNSFDGSGLIQRQSRRVVITEQYCRSRSGTSMLMMGVGEAHPQVFPLGRSLPSWTITKVWELLYWQVQDFTAFPVCDWQILSVEMSPCLHQEVKRWCPRLWKQPSVASQRNSCGWAFPKVRQFTAGALFFFFCFEVDLQWNFSVIAESSPLSEKPPCTLNTFGSRHAGWLADWLTATVRECRHRDRRSVKQWVRGASCCFKHQTLVALSCIRCLHPSFLQMFLTMGKFRKKTEWYCASA